MYAFLSTRIGFIFEADCDVASFEIDRLEIVIANLLISFGTIFIKNSAELT